VVFGAIGVAGNLSRQTLAAMGSLIAIAVETGRLAPGTTVLADPPTSVVDDTVTRYPAELGPAATILFEGLRRK